jgi:hypothetical protein
MDTADHFKKGMADLTRTDSGRINELLEVVQYGGLYCITAFIASSALNLIFTPYSETVSTGRLALEVIWELLLIVIVVYYLRLFVKSIPLMLHVAGGNGKDAYKTAEFNGEIAIGIIFIGVQFRLIKKLDLLSRRLYRTFKRDI